jgi:phosphatidylinositol alpha-mannosyltransferase
MKIGLISFHSFYNPGGVKRHVLGLFNQFRERGMEVKIIVPRRSSSENYGKDVILLGTSFPISFSGSQSDFDINFNPLSIEAVLQKEKFDILHFHNGGLPSSLLSPSATETLNILTFHANLRGSHFVKRFPAFTYALNKICEWKIDGVIGVAPLILDYFKEYSGPKSIIPNGVSIKEFNKDVPKIKEYLDGKTNLLVVGRIEKRKGLIYLLKALNILQKKFSNLRLIIIGEGPLREECAEYVKENNLKDVIFKGRVAGNLSSYYKTADIFVSPAIFGESFGLVLLEAMACGTPVVAFSNEGYAKLLKGKSAERFLAKPKDYNELARKIEMLIKNLKLRDEISKQGIKEAEEYSWTKVADKVLDFYELCRGYKEKREK